ncbi:MAG: cadmium-translocating P-type ATPase [Caldilineae bacterium]|nr:MAG: cadmium-translocating P-type ATPase [Caldilineae bacterium]
MLDRKLELPIEFPDDAQEAQLCAQLLLETLDHHRGVESAEIDFAQGILRLQYDPEQISASVVDGIAADLGLRLRDRTHVCTMGLGGVGCRDCTHRLERELAAMPGVHYVSANPAAHIIGVRYEQESALAEIERRIHELGYEVTPRPDETPLPFWRRNMGLIWAGLTLVFLVAGLLWARLNPLPAFPQLATVFYILAYLAGGHDGAREAARDLRRGELNIDFLMITSALGAAAIGEWAEGATLLFLFSLSGALEEFALDRTHSAIAALTRLRPTEATVLVGGSERRVPVEVVQPGDVLIIRPGEQVPVDGIIVRGATSLDQSAITGESMPVSKEVGDEVFAGTMNREGAIDIRATKRAQDSTLAKVIELVAEAQSERAPTQRLIDRLAHPYAVGVFIAVGLVIAVGTLLLNYPFYDVFYRAMTLLVVASPCALVISTPASILAGIAAGARNGILFKGGVHLENAARINTVAFDKTGTLTSGRPQVTDIVVLDHLDQNEFLRLVASAEWRSEHPIAEAIVREAQARKLRLSEPAHFVSIPGQGVRARIDGYELVIGNERLLNHESRPVSIPESVRDLNRQGKTTIFVQHGERLLGAIALADLPRENARQTVESLRTNDISTIVMLTGDHRQVAEGIATQLGIDEVHAELLPGDKVEVISRLAQQGTVAMVGDGVNDAPALATATVGIAMGAAGTDVALETADIVLMSDDLCKLPFAFKLARHSRRIIAQNMLFAVAVMITLVLATLSVGIPLPLAVVGHEGSTLVVVLNGLRLLRLGSR